MLEAFRMPSFLTHVTYTCRWLTINQAALFVAEMRRRRSGRAPANWRSRLVQRLHQSGKGGVVSWLVKNREH